MQVSVLEGALAAGSVPDSPPASTAEKLGGDYVQSKGTWSTLCVAEEFHV